MRLGNEFVSWVFNGKVVGAHLTFQGPAEVGTAAQRLDEAVECAQRVADLPIGFEGRAFLLRDLVLKKGLYGCAVNHLTGQMLARLRTASLNALGGLAGACAAKKSFSRSYRKATLWMQNRCFATKL